MSARYRQGNGVQNSSIPSRAQEVGLSEHVLIIINKTRRRERCYQGLTFKTAQPSPRQHCSSTIGTGTLLLQFTDFKLNIGVVDRLFVGSDVLSCADASPLPKQTI